MSCTLYDQARMKLADSGLQQSLTVQWHVVVQGLRSIQSASPRLPVRKYDFDWHFMLRELRDAGTVEAMWQKLEALLPESGLACGVMEPATGLADAADGADAAQPEATAGVAPRCPRCKRRIGFGKATFLETI